MKLKRTGLIKGNVELTKRHYLQPNSTPNTHTTTITTATSTTFITANTISATKAKDTKAEKLKNHETILLQTKTHYANTCCQEAVSNSSW